MLDLCGLEQPRRALVGGRQPEPAAHGREREVVAARAPRAVRHHTERLQGQIRGRSLGKNRLRLGARLVTHAGCGQPFRALDALGLREWGDRDATRLEGADLARRRISLRRGGGGEPEIAVDRGSLACAPGRRKRVGHAEPRTRHLGVIGEPVEEATPESGRARVVAGPRRLFRGKEQRGRRRAAIGRGIDRLLCRGARPGDVAKTREGLGLVEQRVLRDGGCGAADLGELARGLRPVLSAVRAERGGKAIAHLGRQARGRGTGRPRRYAGQQEQDAPDGRESRPHAVSLPQGVPGDPPRVEDPLDGRDVGQQGEQRHDWGQQVEGGSSDEGDEPLGPLHHTDFAAHGDGLGARLRIAGHDGAGERSHGQDRARDVTPLLVVDQDAEQHGQVGVAVHHGVEERAVVAV